jgi:hypothetical protein
MVSRLPAPDTQGPMPRWYSQKELAHLWRVHPGTVRNWLWLLRKEGRGPAPDQARYYFYYGARRDLLLRGDYAYLMEMTFVSKT